MDRRTYQALLLFAATGLVIWALGLILLPFLVPIAWAMCLVTVTGGVYARMAKRTHKPRLSALVMTFMVAIAVVVPLLVAGGALVKQARELSRNASAPMASPAAAGSPAPAPVPAAPPLAAAPAAPAGHDAWDEFFADHPRFAVMREKTDQFLSAFKTDSRSLKDAALERLGEPFAAGAVGVLQGFLATAFGFLMMLVTLYFLYRDGPKIRSLVVALSPLTHEETIRILDTLRATAYAAIVGGLATALIQGTLGGIAFFITGVHAPVLWGFVMAALSLLPIGGSTFVWGPVTAYFFLTGETWRAWFLLLWGVIVIGGSYYVLMPWLTRRAGASEIHPLLLFFAIISGVGIFGVSGLVFGPLLIAFLLVVLRIYRENTAKKPAPAKS